MGLSSFFASFRSPKTEGNVSQRASYRQERPRPNTTANAKPSRREYVENTGLPSTPPSATLPPTRDGDQERRKSRGFSLPRQKSQHGLSKRRSWFGGRPDSDADIPAVPMLVYVGNRQPTTPQDDASHSTSGAVSRDTNDKRVPAGRSSSKPSRTTNDDGSSRRKSRSSAHNGEVTTETIPPPIPPMPVNVPHSKQPTTSALPADRRRSRAPSVKSISSVKTSKSRRKSRSSFWVSSNPDDSESDVPPVPALVRDASPDGGSNSSFDHIDSARRGGNIQQPRALSVGTKKKYVPKSAAKGFLVSTNGASEETRKSYRRSFKMQEDVDLVCLNQEQQIEWARLMNEDDKQSPRDAPEKFDGLAGEVTEENKFSNAQALAALELGLRS